MFIKSGKPVLLTDGLVRRLEGRVNLTAPNVQILPVKGSPKALLDLSQSQVDALRAPLLRPLKTTLCAPVGVALYLFRDGSWVLENFKDDVAQVELNGREFEIAARGWEYRWK